jgi:hypothetical protein
MRRYKKYFVAPLIKMKGHSDLNKSDFYKPMIPVVSAFVHGWE